MFLFSEIVFYIFKYKSFSCLIKRKLKNFKLWNFEIFYQYQSEFPRWTAKPRVPGTGAEKWISNTSGYPAKIVLIYGIEMLIWNCDARQVMSYFLAHKNPFTRQGEKLYELEFSWCSSSIWLIQDAKLTFLTNISQFQFLCFNFGRYRIKCLHYFHSYTTF